jgi:hypothetical protein
MTLRRAAIRVRVFPEVLPESARPSDFFVSFLILMVGATGIEPVTPTMST